MAMDLNKTLKAVNKDIKALAKKVDKLIVSVDKLEKGKIVKKKVAKLTAIDTVHGVIKRSKKGIDVASLIKKTGFNRRKIYDTVKVLKKHGKVKSIGIGVYGKV